MFSSSSLRTPPPVSTDCVHTTSIKVCWFLVWFPYYLLNEVTCRLLTLFSAEFNLVTNRPKQRELQGPVHLPKETGTYRDSIYQRNEASTARKGFYPMTLLMANSVRGQLPLCDTLDKSLGKNQLEE